MSGKGFASMTPERRREISRMGGKAVKSENRSFSRDRKLAVASGKKGGIAVKAEDRKFFKDRELARRAGSIGGSAAGKLKVEEEKPWCDICNRYGNCEHI